MAGQKPCRFCVEKTGWIDYKDEPLLRRFINDRGKIVPRRQSGVCALHQRMLTTAIKRARHLAILPYTAESVR
jgi:small subunit ribosomal protein S18